MSDALKDIMNLDFSDKKLLNKNADQTDFNLQVAASTNTKYSEEFTCKQSRFKK